VRSSMLYTHTHTHTHTQRMPHTHTPTRTHTPDGTSPWPRPCQPREATTPVPACTSRHNYYLHYYFMNQHITIIIMFVINYYIIISCISTPAQRHIFFNIIIFNLFFFVCLPVPGRRHSGTIDLQRCAGALTQRPAPILLYILLYIYIYIYMYILY